MSDCILWRGAKAGNGYGVFSQAGKQVYAHRAAAAHAYGPIPAGMVVAHTCDTPACVNPLHLRVCTQRDNLADMRAKGRSAAGDKHRSRLHPEKVLRGESVGTSKLTEGQVAEIRATYTPGPPGKRSDTSLTGLARRFGVSFQTVSKIVNNKTWSAK